MHVDPLLALHEAWHNSSPAIVAATAATGLAARAAGIDWLVVLSVAAVIGPMAFGVVVQCVKQYKITAHEVILNKSYIDARNRLAAPALPERSEPVFRVLPSSVEPGLRILVPDTRPSG